MKSISINPHKPVKLLLASGVWDGAPIPVMELEQERFSFWSPDNDGIWTYWTYDTAIHANYGIDSKTGIEKITATYRVKDIDLVQGPDFTKPIQYDLVDYRVPCGIRDYDGEPFVENDGWLQVLRNNGGLIEGMQEHKDPRLPRFPLTASCP